MAELQRTYPGAQFCVSGMAVSRDIYQYAQYYIQVSVVADGQSVHEMRFLFQDASTQALDNVGGKPWIGLPAAKIDATLNAYVAEQTLTPWSGSVKAFDPLSIAKQSATYKNEGSSIDQATVSVIPVRMNDSRQYSIVSWLTTPGNNPFSTYVALKGVLVVHDPATGAVSIAENLWLTSDLVGLRAKLSFEILNLSFQRRVFGLKLGDVGLLCFAR